MTLRVSTTVSGGERLAELFKRLSRERFATLIVNINRRLIEESIPEIQARTPRRSGKLANGYRTRATPEQGIIEIVNSQFYVLAARFPNSPSGDPSVAAIVERVANDRIAQIAAEEIKKLL